MSYGGDISTLGMKSAPKGAWLALLVVTALSSMPGCAEEDSRTFTVTIKGGQFNAWGASLTVPPGAVTDPLEVTVTRLPSAMRGVVSGTAHLLSPAAATFTRPVTLTLWLAAENLSSAATSADLALVMRSSAGWLPLTVGVDINPTLFISATVSSLGSYAVWDARAATLTDAGADRGHDADAGALPRDLGTPRESGADALSQDANTDMMLDISQADAAQQGDQAADIPLLDAAPPGDQAADIPLLDAAPPGDQAADIPLLDAAPPGDQAVDIPPPADMNGDLFQGTGHGKWINGIGQ